MKRRHKHQERHQNTLTLMWCPMFLGLVYCLISWFYTLRWHESDFSKGLLSILLTVFSIIRKSKIK